jgi:cbb3-type cytochrome oxidase subunit 3
LLAGETAKDRRFQIGLSVLLVVIIGVLWIVFR